MASTNSESGKNADGNVSDPKKVDDIASGIAAATETDADKSDTSHHEQSSTSKNDTDGLELANEKRGIQSTSNATTTTNDDSTKPVKHTMSNSDNQKVITPKKPQKIKVHLVAVGSAPILKKSKFLMNANDRFIVANQFLQKILKLTNGNTTTTKSNSGANASSPSLFLYVNAAFVPSPEERMGDLFDCFGTRGELVIHYSLQEAWG